MKKGLGIAGVLMFIALAAAGWYFWSAYRTFMQVETILVDPLLTVYTGAGNSIVLYSEDGQTALIVDTKMRSAAEQLKKSITAKKIIIVNTHAHLDHMGGNPLYPQAKIIAGEYTEDQWNEDSGGISRTPDVRLKPGEEEAVKLGDETAHILNMGQGHSYHDVVVYLEKRKMLITGDLVFQEIHPAIPPRGETKIALWIDVLETLSKKYDILTLVPGHGAMTDRRALSAMKNYFISIRDAVGHPDRLEALRRQYQNYDSVPFAFSFNRTLQFIEQEYSPPEKSTAE